MCWDVLQKQTGTVSFEIFPKKKIVLKKISLRVVSLSEKIESFGSPEEFLFKRRSLLRRNRAINPTVRLYVWLGSDDESCSKYYTESLMEILLHAATGHIEASVG